MKKEYVIIGAVVLTIGYFVWKNNRKTNIGLGGVNSSNLEFPKKINIAEIKWKECKADPNVNYIIDPCLFTYGEYKGWTVTTDRNRSFVYLGKDGGTTGSYDTNGNFINEVIPQTFTT